MIERLELRNLTVFTGLTLELSPKINVIIGENGTGKTHLLKAAYGLCAGAPLFKNKPDTGDDELEAALTAKLLRLFMPLDDKLGKMHRQGATDQAYLSAKFAGGAEDRRDLLQQLQGAGRSGSRQLREVPGRGGIHPDQGSPLVHEGVQQPVREIRALL